MNYRLIFFISTVVFILLACNTQVSKREKIKIDNGGVHIEYDDSGTGDTALVFVHGWNINKNYWANQSAYFSKRYRVICPDLPGFGKSGKNRDEWTVENYGKDVSAILSKLDLKNVILIGHSMSGAIVLEAALTNPGKVIGVVGIDNFTGYGSVPSAQEKEDITNAYKALKTNYKEIVLQYANQSLFSPSTDSSVRQRVTNDFINNDSVIAVKSLEQADQYPLDKKLISLGKTIYLINSDYHPTDTTGFVKDMIDFCLLDIGPTGHYPMIEKPNEFNLLLEKAINKMGTGK